MKKVSPFLTAFAATSLVFAFASPSQASPTATLNTHTFTFLSAQGPTPPKMRVSIKGVLYNTDPTDAYISVPTTTWRVAPAPQPDSNLGGYTDSFIAAGNSTGLLSYNIDYAGFYDTTTYRATTSVNATNAAATLATQQTYSP